MKELPETIEVYHELVGRQIQDILQENRELKMKLEKQENQLRFIRIQYKSDIQALRDDVTYLEAVNKRNLRKSFEILACRQKIRPKRSEYSKIEEKDYQ